MATANPGDIIHVPGRLIKDPTDLTAPPLFGGTALGIVSEVIWKPNLRRREIRGEEHGGEIMDHIQAGQSPMLGCFVRGFDKNMWPLIFEDVTISTKTGKPQVDYPGVTRAGTLASDNSFKLLYAPENTEDWPGILLYNTYALVEETAQIRLSWKDEFGIAVIFQGIRDATERISQMRLLEDMVL